jgi:hypothetical protein
MSNGSHLNEAEILEQMIHPGDADLSPEAAHALLHLAFDAEATRTIERLLQLNAAGKISGDDRRLLDRYVRIGQLIDLIQAKARLSLAAAKV